MNLWFCDSNIWSRCEREIDFGESGNKNEDLNLLWNGQFPSKCQSKSGLNFVDMGLSSEEWYIATVLDFGH